MVDESEESKARWNAAAERAAGNYSPLPTNRRRTQIAVIAFVVVILVGVGVFVAAFATSTGHATTPRREVSAGQTIAQVVLLVVGVAVAAYGFIRTWRDRRRSPGFIGAPLSRTEQKLVRQQLAGKAPFEPNRLPVLLGIAGQFRSTFVTSVPTYVGATLIALGQLIYFAGSPIAVLVVVSVGVFLLGLIGSIFYVRRYGRFIAENGPAVSPSVAIPVEAPDGTLPGSEGTEVRADG